MLELVRINNASLASRLADLLSRRGIEARVREQRGEYTVLLIDAARHDEARELARDYLADPLAGKWQDDAWRAS